MIRPNVLAYIAKPGAAELLLGVLILAGFVFWLWMIVDCATNEPDAGTKLAWILVVVLVGIIAAPLYFFIRKLPRKPKVAGLV